jgi:hypothetical protein
VARNPQRWKKKITSNVTGIETGRRVPMAIHHPSYHFLDLLYGLISAATEERGTRNLRRPANPKAIL